MQLVHHTEPSGTPPHVGTYVHNDVNHHGLMTMRWGTQ